MRRAADDERTGLLETHPSTRDRIRRAHQEDIQGIFHLQAPASALFADFARLSREVSLEYYNEVVGEPVERKDLLHPVAQLLRQQEQQAEEFEALRRYFQNTASVLRPLPLSETQPRTQPPPDVEQGAQRLGHQRQQLRETMLQYTASLRQYADLDSDMAELIHAEALLSANFSLNRDTFDLPDTSAEGVARALADNRRRRDRLGRQMAAPEQLGARRLELGPLLGSRLYPFAHGSGSITIREHLLPRIPMEDDLGSHMDAASDVLERAHTLYLAVLGRLAAVAEQLEQSLGLEPLEDPPYDEEQGSKEEGEQGS